MTFDDCLAGDSATWLESLEPYQRKTIQALLDQMKDPELAASQWLQASSSQTHYFATSSSPKPFLDAVRKEVLKFLCDDRAYEEQKKKLHEASNITQYFVVSLMTVAIAPVVGTASAFLAPVIVLILISFGRIVRKALCQTSQPDWSGE